MTLVRTSSKRLVATYRYDPENRISSDWFLGNFKARAWHSIAGQWEFGVKAANLLVHARFTSDTAIHVTLEVDVFGLGTVSLPGDLPVEHHLEGEDASAFLNAFGPVLAGGVPVKVRIKQWLRRFLRRRVTHGMTSRSVSPREAKPESLFKPLIFSVEGIQDDAIFRVAEQIHGGRWDEVFSLDTRPFAATDDFVEIRAERDAEGKPLVLMWYHPFELYSDSEVLWTHAISETELERARELCKGDSGKSEPPP